MSSNSCSGVMAMAMTADDVYRSMQDGDVTLAFDTSVTVRRGFLALCDQANWVNERRKALSIPRRIRLCVPVVAHAERLFDLAQQYGDSYDVEAVRRVLGERQIEAPSFAALDAEHCAELLIQRYETPSEWYAFKKRRCLECVGLPPNYHGLAEGTGQRCGASNDWLIIAQASRGGMLLVMDDRGRGGEYALVEHVARYSDVRTALENLLEELINDR